MENKEIWRDIKGYEGIYQASSLGRIRSLDRTITVHRGKSYKANIKGTILKPAVNGRGYLIVVLSGKTLTVHKIIAKTFLKENYKNLEINHKNEIKTDNRVENLEYVTRKENCNYGTRNLRHGLAIKGDNHPHAKPKKYYETFAVERHHFKQTCNNRNWNFNDFDEVFFGIKRGRIKKYFYFEKR